jgi:hypothetical protein
MCIVSYFNAPNFTPKCLLCLGYNTLINRLITYRTLLDRSFEILRDSLAPILDKFMLLTYGSGWQTSVVYNMVFSLRSSKHIKIPADMKDPETWLKILSDNRIYTPLSQDRKIAWTSNLQALARKVLSARHKFAHYDKVVNSSKFTFATLDNIRDLLKHFKEYEAAAKIEDLIEITKIISFSPVGVPFGIEELKQFVAERSRSISSEEDIAEDALVKPEPELPDSEEYTAVEADPEEGSENEDEYTDQYEWEKVALQNRESLE